MAQRQNETQAVKNLQRYLRQLAYDDADMIAPPIDGIFESDTRAALVQFQRARDLPPTGIADRDTWELLYAAYRASLASNSPPRTVALFPRSPKGYTLLQGQRGAPVTALQYMLVELARNNSELENVVISGLYDEDTELAVLAFQRRNVLRQTGEVDLDTWNAITDQYNALFLQFPVE